MERLREHLRDMKPQIEVGVGQRWLENSKKGRVLGTQGPEEKRSPEES